MSTHKKIDRICGGVLALTLVLTWLFACGEAFGLQKAGAAAEYEARLFDATRVHTLDIVMDNWDEFIASCEDEAYENCAVVIDGESYRNVGIRAKGNTSLRSVAAYGNNRYSFKIEFDHYDSTKSYYGLDKLSLNNLIQDNTCMKDFLCYQLMGYFGVAAPLCSYVFITVNGEAWGLYLAAEGVEDGFLQRNFGNDSGNLYKPDSVSFGGGRGNGMDFQFHAQDSSVPQKPQEGGMPSAFPGGGGMVFGEGMGSSDVKLQYIDDDPASYANIFDQAKTKITSADQARLIASLKTLSSESAASVVDAEQVIRYFVVHTFVCNGDSYTGSMVHNYYLYEKDGILSMIPWDYNLAFGGFDSGSSASSIINSPIDTPVSGGNLDDRPMAAWIFNSESYLEKYHQYYAEFLSSFLDSGYLSETIDTVTAMISSYVEEDPTKFCTYEEFLSGTEALKTFCSLRAESISGQLAGTVPSTNEAQQADPSSLIDASGLSIASMGSMNSGGSFDAAEPGGKTGDMPQMPSNAPPSTDGLQTSEGPWGTPTSTMRLPAETGQAGEENSESSFMLLTVSVVVLLAGLLLATAYRRRR